MAGNMSTNCCSRACQKPSLKQTKERDFGGAKWAFCTVLSPIPFNEVLGAGLPTPPGARPEVSQN